MNFKINTSKTREKYPLSRKKIIKKTITGSIGCAIVTLTMACVGSVVFISLFQDSWQMVWVVALLFLVFFIGMTVLLYIYQTWYFSFYYYEIKEDYIVIKKGPIIPNEINIVYQKIQDVYVDQDLFDRFFGLYDVHIATATYASGNLAHIDGLEKKEAEGLRDELLDIFKNKVNK